MTLKCSCCGKDVSYSFISGIKKSINKKGVLCPDCQNYEDWKNETSPDSFIGKDEILLKGYHPDAENWIRDHIGKICVIHSYFVKSCAVIIKDYKYGLITADEIFPEKKDLLISILKGVSIRVEPDGNEMKFVVDENRSVMGFKAVKEDDLILRSSNHIYEIGIPFEKPVGDPLDTDYSEAYAHFNVSLENVIGFWKNEFLDASRTTMFRCRIFRVKAENHVFQTQNEGWVANKLTLLSEVTQDEIIEYFSENPDAKQRLFEMWNDNEEESPEEVWKRYCSVKIPNYIPYDPVDDDSDDLDHLFLNSCAFLSMSGCNGYGTIKKCFSCKNFVYFQESRVKNYYYIVLRNKINHGEQTNEIINCEEYSYLSKNHCFTEIDALFRLLKYYEKNPRELDRDFLFM